MRYRDEREHDIEDFAAEEAKRRKGIALKFQTPGRIGAPDRIVILPGPRIGFLELKHPKGGHVRAGQPRYQKMLKDFGLVCMMVNSRADVVRFYNALAAVPPMAMQASGVLTTYEELLS